MSMDHLELQLHVLIRLLKAVLGTLLLHIYLALETGDRRMQLLCEIFIFCFPLLVVLMCFVLKFVAVVLFLFKCQSSHSVGAGAILLNHAIFDCMIYVYVFSSQFLVKDFTS